jgi:diguanylate cyclase (GGDEF)-like protein/PAS domain S-box-containing protein
MTAIPNPALHEATIARKVMAERVKLFTDRMVAGALISPLGTALLAGIEGPVAGWDRAALWLCVINLVEFLIVAMGYRYRMTKREEEDAPRWKNAQIVCAALLGPAWGSSVWFFWVDGQILFYVVNLTVLVCVSSVTLIILSPFRSATILFSAGILFPPLLHLAFVANPLVVQVAAGLAVLFVVQLRYAQVTEGQLLGELDSSVRNLALAEQLKESEERFRLAMEAASDGVWDWDLVNENRCYFSPAYFQMLGYEPDALPMTAQTWIELIHPEDYQRVLSANQDCIENRRPSFEVEYRIKAKDGSWKWVLGRGKAVLRDADGKAIRMIGTHVDITERKRAEEALREMATTDYLTGLVNRRSFFARLDEELERLHRAIESPVALLMLDLDFFKNVNDTYGHAAGDALLKHFSAMVTGEVRLIDTVGRLGGEEFGIIFPGADLKATKVLADRLCQRVSRSPLLFNGQEIRITVSVGVTDVKATDSNSDAPLARADAALYRAKQLGRNRVETSGEEATAIDSQISLH